MRPYFWFTTLFVLLYIGLAWGVYTSSLDWTVFIPAILLHLGILFVGVTQIRVNFFVKSLNNGPRNSNWVALTFDDGPNMYTHTILDILKEQQVQATFFLIGENVEKDPATTKRYVEEGHIIGNHSYGHSFFFDMKSPENMLADMEKANQLIAGITGKEPLLFRAPYGITNPGLARAIKRSTLTNVGWNLRSFDTVVKDPRVLKNRVLGKLKGGDVVLLHDSMPVTAAILKDLIVEIHKRGFTFVGIDKMFSIEAYEA